MPEHRLHGGRRPCSIGLTHKRFLIALNMDGCLTIEEVMFRETEVKIAAVQVKELSDHELIDQTREGNEEAFGELMLRYQNPLTNYLYRMLNDYEEAVDLAQESFVRLYQAIDRYHSGYAFSTYIYRSATNLAISELRKRKRRWLYSLTGLFQFDGDEKKEFQPADEKPLPEDNTISGEKLAAIERAISALPEKYKAPIVLREVQELTYEEVAKVLGLGLGTTKSRISRGRGLLREKLKSYIG